MDRLGCTVASAVERIEHGGIASLYSSECKDTMSKVMDYVKSLYPTCALPSF